MQINQYVMRQLKTRGWILMCMYIANIMFKLGFENTCASIASQLAGVHNNYELDV